MDDNTKELRWATLHADIRDIKGNVQTLVEKAAIHNELLKEHERRSTNLEDRFQPIEHIYIFAAKSAALIALVGGVISMILGAIKIISVISPS